jgi:hypothetical protein
MFFPFRTATLLALESSRVIGLRLNRLAAGGKNAADEAHLMVSEKVHAAAKAAATLMTGGSPSKVVRQYRKRVPANVARLSRLPKKKRRRSRRR